jgi:hypothetical protein
MMWRVVLEQVDKTLAEALTQILIREGWNAGHQKSYPVVEVMVRTETDNEAAPLRRILETHIIRQPELNNVATQLRNRKTLIKELSDMGKNVIYRTEINESFEDLLDNPLKVSQLYNEYNKGRERFYLRSRTGGYSIGFSNPKGKKRLKFWIVGQPKTR